MNSAKRDKNGRYAIRPWSRRRLLGAAAGLAAAVLGLLSPLPRPAGAAQPAPQDAIPFAVFLAKMDIVSSVQAFDMRGPFVLAAGGTIDLAADDVTVQLSNQTHTASITIPKGSFEKEYDWYVYYGAIGGVPLEAAVVPFGGGRYAFEIGAVGVPNLPVGNPVTVTLTIGNNSGSVTVNASIR